MKTNANPSNADGSANTIVLLCEWVSLRIAVVCVCACVLVVTVAVAPVAPVAPIAPVLALTSPDRQTLH